MPNLETGCFLWKSLLLCFHKSNFYFYFKRKSLTDQKNSSFHLCHFPWTPKILTALNEHASKSLKWQPHVHGRAAICTGPETKRHTQQAAQKLCPCWSVQRGPHYPGVWGSRTTAALIMYESAHCTFHWEIAHHLTMKHEQEREANNGDKTLASVQKIMTGFCL